MNTFRLNFHLVLFLLSIIREAAPTAAITGGSATAISDGEKAYENRGKGTTITGFCWGMFNNAVGDVATGFGIYDWATTPSNQDLADELLHVQVQLEDIKRSITELINQVEEESIRTQYVNSERVIVESLSCENIYGNMTEAQDVDYWRREFLKWGSMLRESVSFLLDGILGKGMIGSDILETIVKIVNSGGGNRTARFQSVTDQLYGLVNSGLVVHASFVGFNNISTIANAPVVDLFDASYYNMSKRINDTLKTCGTSNGCTLPSSSVYRATRPQSVAFKSTRPKRQMMIVTMSLIGFMNDMFSRGNDIVGVYRFFNQPNNAELMYQIKSIEDQLDQVQTGINELVAEIADGSMRTQYVSSQRVIMESLRIASNYVNVSNEVGATPDDLDYWASEMGKWGSLVRESVMFLMDGFLGHNVLAGDLLKYLVVAEQHNATAIEKRFNETIALVNTGLIVHALFANFTGISETANAPVVAGFEESYTNIGLRFEKTINNQEDRWTIESKMEEIILQSSSNDSIAANSIYSYLTTKAAPDRNWYVVVFYFAEDREGWEQERTHYFDGDFYRVNNVGGKKMNAAAISYPTKLNTQKVTPVDSATSDAINNFNCNKEYKTARPPVDEMHMSLASTCPTCRIGSVIEYFYDKYCTPMDRGQGCTVINCITRASRVIGSLLNDAVETRKDCGAFEDYQYELSILPGTRRFTVPEEE